MTRDGDADEDRAQEVALARLEAIRLGFDPEPAAREASARFDRAEATRRARVVGEIGRSGLDWLPEARRLVPTGPAVADRPRRDRDRVRARRRACRLALIRIGAAAGMSHGQIGDALNLSRSAVRKLVEARGGIRCS